MNFFEFLDLVSPRFLQERDVGLDLYLSGVSAWVPLALAVVSATVFALALFHVVPSRRHSVPILFGIAVVAVLVGAAGAWFACSRLPLVAGEPVPRILTDGRGRFPETDAHRATLLALPLLVGVATGLESVACAVFLLLFGGKDVERRDAERRGRGDD